LALRLFDQEFLKLGLGWLGLRLSLQLDLRSRSFFFERATIVLEVGTYHMTYKWAYLR